MSLQGKVCIITGGGSGIGRSAALMMAEQGASLVLAGRTVSKVEEVTKEIESTGGKALAIGLDVSDRDAVQRMAQQAMDAFGRIDVLVNNAGHSSYHRRTLTTTAEEMQAVLNSNLIGTIYCTQAVLPYMLEAGQGTIINVSSMAGVNPGLMGGMIYSAAKAAVNNFTTFLTNEFRNTGIRASVVIPGEIDTPILEKRPTVPTREARDTMATPEDVAEAIVMIAGLPQRASVPELIIRPTMNRDQSEELAKSP